MTTPVGRSSRLHQTAQLAHQALRLWTPKQFAIAALAGAAVALLIGVATVLIPNPVFGRDIPPVWWNYPVWILTSALTGMLISTYVRPSGVSGSGQGAANDDDAAAELSAADDDGAPDGVRPLTDRQERRTGRFGMAGTVLAWFAVGCPVCNKIALLALGYTGAITWFTPIQPFLALGALVLTGAALLWRLRGQVACPVPATMLAQAR